MSSSSQDPSNNNNRADIISSVRTPLGYFTLVLLIVESLLFLLGTRASGFDYTLLICSMVIILFIIVIMVGYIVYKKPDALTNGGAGPDTQISENHDLFRRELLNDDIIHSMDYIARHNGDDYIRIACAHTVWSCRPDRAKSLLEDATRDQAEVVRVHAQKILAKFYQK